MMIFITKGDEILKIKFLQTYWLPPKIYSVVPSYQIF